MKSTAPPDMAATGARPSPPCYDAPPAFRGNVAMLDAVTKGFRAAKHKLTGKAELNEADVELNVAKRFLARVKEKALGEVVSTTATDKKGRKVQASPGDHFIKICHDELENLMGPVDTSLRLGKGDRPAGVMLVGLQGSGKTTTVAKLANLLL